MIVEVIAVGTELLLGQITNRNAAFLGEKLAESGFDAHYQVVVGDNLDRMVDAIKIALGRADVIIMTGGIGPTQDDVTREAISAATGRPLVFSQEFAERLRSFWEARGRRMPESNLRQAEYPEGAEQIPNLKGTAPAIALQHDGRWIFALPGVPEEMHYLMQHEVLPRLRTAAGVDQVVLSRLLRSWGRSESQVAELLDDIYHGSTNPSIAFLASAAEIKVRITAKARTEAEATRLIAPYEGTIRERLGASVFGVDDETIERVILGLLEERQWTMATAESATAGLIAARMTSVPGASKVFRGGVVVYATDLKASLLDVPQEILDEGVVSEATALFMAEGAAARLRADVAVAVTGSAGPDPQERAAGTMVIAVHTPEGSRARVMRLPGDRERVRTYAATAALHLVRLALVGEWWEA
ncbi:MAG: competence/damage-inducible protein A [Acidimicrobiia bacterium]|nr:competence/damage-inducible protein A [Acidimicrobiia bacterium]